VTPALHSRRTALESLAGRGIFVGTSSWKYPGWIGPLYQEQNYLTRGRFSGAKFERLCLAEYAALFPSVCVDASYYRFPTAGFLDSLAGQVPHGFLLSHKVPDSITIRNYPNLPRHGRHAGRANPHFLDHRLLLSSFLRPLTPHHEKTGLLILEFSRFHPRDFERGRDFLAALDAFLGQLPAGEWDFAVELRNRSLLRPEYFEILHRHHVGHVYNHWTLMPPCLEQLARQPAHQLPGPCGMRLLLRPGRTYQHAVDAFQPYDQLREEQPEARQAAAEFLRQHTRHPKSRRAFLYVNNRLEGNALATIAAILDAFACDSP
jgi:uncharacterized protein YecE (DUF72 family)